MDIKDVTPELKEKALACKTTEELVELAKSVGVDLSDEELDGIAGGDWNCGKCNDDHGCGSGNTRAYAGNDGGIKSMM